MVRGAWIVVAWLAMAPVLALAQEDPTTSDITGVREAPPPAKKPGTLSKLENVAGKVAGAYGKVQDKIQTVTGLKAADRALTTSDWSQRHVRWATVLRTVKAGGTGFVFSGLNPIGAVVSAGRYATIKDTHSPLQQKLAATPPGRFLRAHRTAALYADAALGAAITGARGGGGTGAASSAADSLGNAVGNSVNLTPTGGKGDPAKLAEAQAYHPADVDPSALSPDEAQDYANAQRYAPVLLEGVSGDGASLDLPVDPFRPGESNVLYDVQETDTHTYLSYFVYHKADEGRVGAGDQQNDLEGLTVSVAKSGAYAGRPDAVITLAHDEFFAHDLTRGKQLEEGDRVVVRIEAGPHGIYAVDAHDPNVAARIAGALDLRADVRNHLLAKPAKETVRYEPGDPSAPAADGQGTYGLRPLTDTELEKLGALFAGTPGNGARTPDQWTDPGRAARGELLTDPESVFERLVRGHGDQTAAAQ